jgi:predicted phosphate transport protein (TIGR00153 family)
MLNWVNRLLPQEHTFFPLFDQQAALLAHGAAALRAMLEGGAEVARHCQEVVRREEEADEVTRRVLIGIRTTFITPFDRGDIRALITAMDDCIDQMQKTAKAIILFEMSTFEPDMRAMADAIIQCAELIRRAVPLLSRINRHAGQLNEICLHLTRIEGQGDEIHDRGLRILYQRTRSGDAMEFIRGQEIYLHLEKVIDSFDDVGNQIQGIVVEHV